MEITLDKTYAWFAIYDFNCPSEEITEKLGIKATETWLKGDQKPFGKGKITIRNNTWKLKSPLSVSDSIEKHLDYLIATLIPVKDEVVTYADKYFVEFGCAIYFKDNNPGVHLGKQHIKQLAEFNAELDIDMYYLQK